MADNIKLNVVGGGLAGMVAAYELVQRGFDVDLYESTSRLGGKAGSDYNICLFDKHGKLDPKLSLPDGVASDHGYHVFPKWYTNMRQLWEQIGVGSEDVYEGLLYLDQPPATDGVRQPVAKEEDASPQQLMAICDLFLQPDKAVDNLTLQAFLHSRDYFQPDNPISLNSFILNALTIGDADISSRACRNVFRQWIPVFPEKNWDALRGSLQRVLIDRLEAAIHKEAENAGTSCTIHYGHSMIDLELDDDGFAVVTIEGDGNPVTRQLAKDPIILAIPQEILRSFNSQQLFTSLPQLSKLHYLRSNPFTALDVFFTRKLDGMPEEHFTLQDSYWGLTGFEISQHWPELADYPGSVIQLVAANSRSLTGLDAEGFISVIVDELKRYYPEIPDDVAFFVPHTNMDVPLFVNDVNTWDARPEPLTASPNLFLAGDFTQNDTDVTSMEGAVRTGRNAAEHIRIQYASETPEVPIQPTTPIPPQMQQLIQLAEFDPVGARLALFGAFAAMRA